MAMNKQRRTSNISNIFSYDDAGNIVIKDYGQVTRYSWNGLIHGFVGPVSVSSVSAATTDTDRFLVSDGGVLKYRTGVELLSDIGGVPSTRTLTINGTAFDLSADRSWTIAAGISGTGATGQVAYWNGTNSQTGSNNLFWDAANSRLGIGTNAPQKELHIYTAGTNEGAGFRVTPSQSGGVASIQFSNTSNANRGSLGYWDVGNGFYPNRLLMYAPSQTSSFTIVAGSTNHTFHTSTGNVSINSLTDGGQRLQVYGDTLLRGSGATSATTALLVQNSSSNMCFQVFNDQNVAIASGAYFGASNIIRVGASSSAAANLRFTTSSNYLGFYGNEITTALFLVNPSSSNNTSGTNLTVWGFAHTFNPTSGTASYVTVGIAPTINQTGGANGITRGLYVNPTLTAAADWRSIEWSNNSGWGLYGAGTANNYLGGKLGIGTTDLAAFSFRVANNITTFGIAITGTIQSPASFSRLFYSQLNTQAASFVINDLRYYDTYQNSIGAGSSITNQYGFFAHSSLVGATNNYGFYGDIPSGTNRWNLYMAGTADNYLRGKLLINTTSVETFALDVNGTARVSGDLTSTSTNATGAVGTLTGARTFIDNATTYGRVSAYNFTTNAWLPLLTGDSQVVMSNSVSGRIERLIGTTASFSGVVKMLNTSTVFGASETLGIFAPGAYSSPTIYPAVDSNSIGILDINGTVAPIFMCGSKFSIQIGTGTNSKVAQFSPTSGNFIIQNGGTFTDNSSALIQMNSSSKGFLPPRMTTTQKNAIGTPAAGLQVYDSTTNIPNYYDGTAWVAMGGGSGSGTYTPTVTVVSGGATSVTSNVARYIRVGNVVTVYGAFFYQPSGSGAVETNNQFSITLPITRTVTTNFASGTVSFSTVSGVGNQAQGYLFSTATTTIDLYAQNWWSGSGANAYYVFSYEIN